MRRLRVDPFALAAVLVTVGMLFAYAQIMRSQDDRPVLWFTAGLVLAAAGAAYGTVPASPHRRAVLTAAGVVLVAFGLLAILSIGLPVLVAGSLCLLAAARGGRGRQTAGGPADGGSSGRRRLRRS